MISKILTKSTYILIQHARNRKKMVVIEALKIIRIRSNDLRIRVVDHVAIKTVEKHKKFIKLGFITHRSKTFQSTRTLLDTS